jgi:hypothetical protein
MRKKLIRQSNLLWLLFDIDNVEVFVIMIIG